MRAWKLRDIVWRRNPNEIIVRVNVYNEGIIDPNIVTYERKILVYSDWWCEIRHMPNLMDKMQMDSPNVRNHANLMITRNKWIIYATELDYGQICQNYELRSRKPECFNVSDLRMKCDKWKYSELGKKIYISIYVIKKWANRQRWWMNEVL